MGVTKNYLRSNTELHSFFKKLNSVIKDENTEETLATAYDFVCDNEESVKMLGSGLWFTIITKLEEFVCSYDLRKIKIGRTYLERLGYKIYHWDNDSEYDDFVSDNDTIDGFDEDDSEYYQGMSLSGLRAPAS